MTTELIMNIRPHETRIALVENGTVVEYYLERLSIEDIAGNIYKGKVIRVLPGMQASFVDLGLAKAAFLYVADVYNHEREYLKLLDHESREADEFHQEHSENESENNNNGRFQIEDLLHEGQEITVQVIKGPIGNKGARITTYITIPGRNLVLMPTVNHIGISRRIEDEAERQRLKDGIEETRTNDFGYIARTASDGISIDKIGPEMEFLDKLWNNIQNRAEHSAAPNLLHQDLDVTLRTVRDLFTREVDRLVVDSVEAHEKILSFIDTFSPHLKAGVELYQSPEPVFDYYDIEAEIDRALSRKVWLKSGGYIVIDSTEALVSIDVNTGRYVGKHNLEETILLTNLEAVKEIAFQMRLRNIGGLIVIDFIDIERESNREKVWTALVEALVKDKAKTNVLKMSELGLIEMTRQRTRENIGDVLREPCFYCQGEGLLLSKTSICFEAFRDLEREASQSSATSLYLTVNPIIKKMLLDEESESISDLELRFSKRVHIKEDAALHVEEYRINSL